MTGLIIDQTKSEISSASGYVSIPKLSFGVDGTIKMPLTDGATGHYLRTNGSGDIVWDLPKLSDDNTPTLSGDLNVNGNKIISSGNIEFSVGGDFIIGSLKYPKISGIAGQYLTSNGAGALVWGTPHVASDTAPMLGGDLDMNGYSLVSSGSITLNPTSHVIISGLTMPTSDGASGQVLTTDGNGKLGWATPITDNTTVVEHDITPKLGGNLDVNGYLITSSTDIVLTASGKIQIGEIKLPSDGGSSGQILITDGNGNLQWGNLSSSTTLENDTTPSLGGDLDVNGHDLVSAGLVNIRSNIAISSGNFTQNDDARAGLYVLRGETTSSETTELLTKSAQRLVIPNDTTWSFVIQIAARRVDADNESAAYKIEGAIDNNSTSTMLVGSPYRIDMAEDNISWDVAVEANDDYNSLSVFVTGEDDKTIRWVAFITTAEVTG